MTVYTITKGFTTRTERSPRVLEMAETFGLGLSDQTFHVFRNLAVEVRQGDVVYITGQSGSGKSLLLRELAAQMAAEGKRVTSIEDVALENCALIDQVGSSMPDAIELLSRAGINDAYLAVRKPAELSDGQRYRLRLAKLMMTEAEVWVADEFGAILDRVTARAVAFNAAKLARARGVTLIVATTHTDLIEELGPDLIVEKRFANRVEMVRPRDLDPK
jgi:ABC-type ATPase with predicted acetyltransferase domain